FACPATLPIMPDSDANENAAVTSPDIQQHETTMETGNTASPGWPLHFLVFSFNRGEFLAHCINSIQRCAPGCAITIHDDNSSDTQTQQILAELAGLDKNITVVQPPADSMDSKHGGLYGNMQRACAAVADDVLICTLQDDMQLVRPLQRNELDQWLALYQSGQHHGFLQPAFLKSLGKKISVDDVHYDSNKQVYTVNRSQRSAGAWYSDVFMIPARLLREHDWQFATRESGNEQQARQHFDQMGYLRNPFVAWLPGAPAWRGKRRTLAMKLAERTRRCGFYPLQIMSADQSAAFCARDPGQLPIAETWLSLAPMENGSQSVSLEQPWFYYPLQDQRALKLANRVELALGKLIGR
ncbi:MAG: glycosyltransferase, partial [Natronospirillum sp.]